LIRNIVIHVSSSHSRPGHVAWTIRESSWTVGKSREVLLDEGSFPVPIGGVEAVLVAAITEVLAKSQSRMRSVSADLEVRLKDAPDD